ncbi:MAG: glycosyltransferase [Armatimonadota bacterium]|jgi:glycosyltransferase involved in cell wall biosynthesis
MSSEGKRASATHNPDAVADRGDAGLVSVVLPVRFVNRRWLERSIRSVLEQDYRNLELIVVNDEATEDIDDLVADLGVTKYVRNERNLKLPASLNRGFALAEGRFHTWTSADNYMLPGMISTLVGALETHEGAGIVCGSSIDVDADGQLIDWGGERRAAALSGTRLEDCIIQRRFLYYSTLGACFLYRREVTERLGGYDETLHGAEDYDFWIRASRHFQILRLPIEAEPLYAYRAHGDAISATLRYCFTRLRAEVLRRELRVSPEDHHLRQAYRHHRRLYRQEWLRHCLPVRAARSVVRRVARRLRRRADGDA